MRRVVVAAVGLLAMSGARPSWGGEVEPVRLPDGSALTTVEFDRHVASLFGRLGCNAGACHGSFQGRGGLNLSLFGHDPARDYATLTRTALSRRVDVIDPERSLLLLKPTGQVPHEGGQRFTIDSWEYRVIRAWIAQGARRDSSRAAVEGIEIRPGLVNLERRGGVGRLSVVARFADGDMLDVTAFCDFRVRDDSVAAISAGGLVRGLRPGDTAIVASYNGQLASARVLVPTGRVVTVPDIPRCDTIDREVFAKLKSLGVAPSEQASDAEFVRRVTLDLIGTLPSPQEIRAFLGDCGLSKRSRKIDELLAHPMHAALWATRFLDITGCDVGAIEGPGELKGRRAQLWHEWFRKRFAENTPYSEIARGVITATSRDGLDPDAWAAREAVRMIALKTGAATDYASKPSLDLYWRRFAGGEYVAVEPMAERTAAAFLGVRVECAQCHKHPFDRWTQADYRAFANVFANVRFGLSPDSLAATARLLEERRKSAPNRALPPIPRLSEIYLSEHPSRRLLDPTTGRPYRPKALGGPELSAAGDPREQLFAWLVAPDNPYFARSFVNRVWAAYFGAGLVDPVDGFSVANPPSNERLLDGLAADFVATGYDIRRLERAILSSRAYQRSSEPCEGNLDDRGNFARFEPRPMMAEVLVDALNAALGVTGDFAADAPPGARAIEIATNRVSSPDLARVFRIFGRPARVAVCDCERTAKPALPQTLFFMTDAALCEKIKSGRLKDLLGSGRCDAQVVEELFLATLSRAPDVDELSAALDRLGLYPTERRPLPMCSGRSSTRGSLCSTIEMKREGVRSWPGHESTARGFIDATS
jgi:Protein of unknown function (DUF1549)/Protein of unknown function (DUF1553)